MNLKSILIVAALAIGGAAIAQNGAKAGAGGQKPGNGRQGGPGGPGGFRARTPEERADRLSKELKLTAEQKKKVVALYKTNDPKGRAIFDNKKMTQEQKQAAFMKLREENNKKLNAILNKDQQKKFAEMRSRMRQGGPGGQGQRRGPGAGAAGGGAKAGSGAGVKSGRG